MADDLNNILYVEDEPDIRTIVSMTLEVMGGFSVTACASGGEALERLDEQDFDLVLLDVMMPEMDGPATLHAMREREPQGAGPPVVFMTAKTQPADLQRFRGLGVHHVIPKPFQPANLPLEIQRIWAGMRDGAPRD